MNNLPRRNTRVPTRFRGFTLVELMIALVLGLLVSTAAVAIFMSNGQTYRASEGVGRIQENARIAYELMARDVREGGGNSCANTIPVANVLRNANSQWYSTWAGGMRGFENGALPPGVLATVAGSDAIQIVAADDNPVSVISHNPIGNSMTVNDSTSGLNALDILMICDYRTAAIFQVKTVTSGSGISTLTYDTSGSAPNGNCTTNLTYPVNCGSTGGTTFQPRAFVSRLHSVQWYVAPNGNGGTSLYQRQWRLGGVPVAQEIVEGVTNMQINYLVTGDNNYAPAAAGTNWAKVVAVRIDLTYRGGNDMQTAGALNGTPLTREMRHVITIRNHAE